MLKMETLEYSGLASLSMVYEGLHSVEAEGIGTVSAEKENNLDQEENAFDETKIVLKDENRVFLRISCIRNAL